MSKKCKQSSVNSIQLGT